MSQLATAVSFEPGFSAYSGYVTLHAIIENDGAPLCQLQGVFKGDSTHQVAANTAKHVANWSVPEPWSTANPQPKQMGIAQALIGSAFASGIAILDEDGNISVQFGVAGTITWCTINLSYNGYIIP